MTKDTQLTILCAGVGLGVVAGFILARYCGDDLQQRAKNAKGYIKDQAEALGDRVQSVAEQGRDKLAKGQDAARELGRKVRDTVGSAMDTATRTTVETLDQSGAALQKAGKIVESHG